MINMSYCRFENTYKALLECKEHLCENLSDREDAYSDKLVQLCKQILEDCDFKIIDKNGEPEND